MQSVERKQNKVQQKNRVYVGGNAVDYECKVAADCNRAKRHHSVHAKSEKNEQ
jgi:hypothetical protein